MSKVFDFEELKPWERMLQWLADDPYEAIRMSFEDILKSQVADSNLTELRVVSKPDSLTGARIPPDGDRTKAILVRFGIAFEFALTVEAGAQVHQLGGVYTMVGAQLDTPEYKHRVWMDIDGRLDEFGSEGELKQRMYFETYMD